MLFVLAAAEAAPSSHIHAPGSPAQLVAAVKEHLETGEGCLTPLVAELKQRADELSPEERAWATRTFNPGKRDFLDVPDHGPAGPPPPDAGEPCNSPASLGVGDGDNELSSEHFTVMWDGNTIDEDTAQEFLDSLEDGWRVEVDELGWKEPMLSSQYKMLAFVAPGNYASAYTTVDYCGSSFAPYIVAYAGSFYNRSWGQTMAVHEFNHSTQFSYGFAWEFYWWEATATYMEGQVYPSSTWWAESVYGWAANPQLAFNASDQGDDDIFWHMYGMAIWAQYLHENVDGNATVLGTWEAAENERGTYSFSMADAMLEMDLDFDALFEDFIVKNTVMAYEAQRDLPSPDELSGIDELPASEEVDGSKRPQGYGQTYTRIDAGAGNGDLIINFSGETDVNWAVHLVEIDRNSVLRDVKVDVVEGVGTATLEAFGDEDVMLVVAPMEEGDSKYNYSYTLALAEVPEVEDTGTDTPGKNANAGEETAGCGCDAGGGGAAGVGVLLGLLAVGRRRR